MSMYSMEEYTNIKHVMYDGTAAIRKDWHRTVFTGPRPASTTRGEHGNDE
jgi:betaine-aldehyde dehydrogenase